MSGRRVTINLTNHAGLLTSANANAMLPLAANRDICKFNKAFL